MSRTGSPDEATAPSPRSSRTSRFAPRFAVGLVAGLVTAMSVPPMGLWIAGIVGLGIHAAHLRRRGLRGRLVAGLGFGFGLYTVGIFWTHEFSWPGFIALVAIETFFAVVSAALAIAGGRGAAPFLFGAAMALGEWGRTVAPFEGFPMGGITLGQAAGPLAPAARTGGAVFGVTLAVCLAAAAVAEIVGAVATVKGRADHGRVAGAAGAAVCCVALVGLGGGAGRASGSLRVALVQGGGPRGTRALTTDPRVVFTRHLEASQTLVGGTGATPDIVLWPENTVKTDDLLAATDEGDALRSLAERLGGPTLMVGVVEDVRDDPTHFSNYQTAIGPDGRILGRYDKVHRVPFGEYAPLRSFVARFADLSLLPKDAIPGTEPGILTTATGTPAGVLISYELFFGDRATASVRAGAQILLGPTNAASYRTSQVPDQELAAARLRAWETGRDIALVAPTGFSAFVLADGTVHAKTALSQRTVIQRELTLHTGHTPYVRTGDRPWLILCALVAAGGLCNDVVTRVRARTPARRR